MESFERDRLRFDVTDVGPAEGPVVILLHGFPEDRGSWSGIAPVLADNGYRVLAPDQRGYSPGARPSGRRAYRVEELAADVLALADAAGAETFDVVGHDWGAVVAWALAARHPSRVRTVAALSVPHTQAFLRSMLHSTQALRSWYMVLFQLPVVPERLLGGKGGRRLADALVSSGLSRGAADHYGRRASEPSGMTGPLSWYRALPLGIRTALPPVAVPTLYIYGDGDTALTRAAADACSDWVTGPYRYEVIAGGGHWLPEDRADEVSRMLLEHLRSVP